MCFFATATDPGFDTFYTFSPPSIFGPWATRQLYVLVLVVLSLVQKCQSLIAPIHKHVVLSLPDIPWTMDFLLEKSTYVDPSW